MSHTHPHKLYTGSMFLQDLEELNGSGRGSCPDPRFFGQAGAHETSLTIPYLGGQITRDLVLVFFIILIVSITKIL